MSTTTKAAVYFSKYEECHRHPTNILIHRVAVPLILFSILGALWPVQVAGVRAIWPALAFLMGFALWLNWRLSAPFAMELAAMAGLAAFLSARVGWAMQPMMLALFVGAWIAQFVGHRIEGKKPAFFDDLFFLLVGPLWTLHLIVDRQKI